MNAAMDRGQEPPNALLNQVLTETRSYLQQNMELTHEFLTKSNSVWFPE
jgi:hypothetical protein